MVKQFVWYKLSAEQGIGVERDYKEALKWFKLSADQNNSQVNMQNSELMAYLFIKIRFTN